MAAVLQDDFSKLEHEGWTRASELYHDSWANLTRQYIEPLLDEVALKPAMSVLDIACGPGYVSGAVVERQGIPIGVDFSSTMIQLAESMYPGIDFVEGDAQALDFVDGLFDRVVMNFGMLHLSKPEVAIAEACRVLKKGGRFAFTVWAGPDKSPAARVMFENIMKLADQNVNMPSAPPSYLFSDENHCREVMTRNGFDESSFRFRYHYAEWLVPSAEFYFETELTAGVRTASFLNRQSPETLDRIRQAVNQGMEQFREEKGYRLQFGGCIISASRK